MRPAIFYAVICLLLVPPFAAAQTPSARKSVAAGPRLFLQIRAQQLCFGQRPFRNVGATIPDLFERFLRGDESEASKALTDAQAAGIRFVRCAGLPRQAADYRLFTSDRSRWLAAYDRMLAIADSHNIAVIPSLLYDIHTLPQAAGGVTTTVQPIDMLTADSPANHLAVAYVTAVVTRYRNDARILFWEIGNEYNLLADRASLRGGPKSASPSISDRIRAFLGQMAALIHRIDKRHLITSGNGEVPPYAAHLPHHWSDRHYAPVSPDSNETDTFAQYQEMLDFFNPPGIDIISVHEHPPAEAKVDWLTEDDIHALRVSWTQYACTALGKPLFVGAFGQQILVEGKEQQPLWLLDFLRRLQAEGAPLAAVQSWEPGTEDHTVDVEAITPQLTFAVKVVNATIVTAQVNDEILTTGPALDLSAKAMQADRKRLLINLLRALSAVTGVF